MKYGENIKDDRSGATEELEPFNPPSVASRARNRTVMLSPDVTGQVRSLLQSPVTQRSTTRGDDPFQKPSKMVKPTESFGSEEIKRTSEPTRVHKVVESEPFISAPRSDKVEGTLELKREHSKRATGERKLDELGIGISPPEREAKLVEERKSVNLGLELKNPFVDHLVPQPVPEPIKKPKAPVVSSRIVGFLVSFDKEEVGEVFEVRVGRWLVTSKPSDQDSIILIEDNSISPLHAVIKVSVSGEIQVMDQLSDNGSSVLKINSNSELDASEAPVRLQHGDLVRFGRRYFVFCGVPKMQIEN